MKLKSELERDYELFLEGKLDKIRNPKLKCPICKKKNKFECFDLGAINSSGFIKGYYAKLLVCSKCNIVICKSEEELKNEKN